MNIRARKQLETAKKKGRVSADIFEVYNEARLQDVSSKKWNKVGKIKEKRVGDDGQGISFVILMGNGRETIRHNVTRYTKVTDKKVTFNLENERGGEDKNVKETETKKRGRPKKEEKGGEDKNTKETETKKRGRPRKEDKAESNNKYKTATDSNTYFNIGIAKRTRSKTSTDLPDIPLKSSLKQRTEHS